MTKECRKATKQVAINPITQRICKAVNHVGSLKFVFKGSDKDNEKYKLIVVSPYKENIPKLTTRFHRRQLKITMYLVTKSELMPSNSKSSCLTKVLTD